MKLQTPLTQSYWPADQREQLWDSTLGDLLRAAAAKAPDRVALVDGAPQREMRRRWTYTELLKAAEDAARALLTLFSPGDCVALCAGNSAEWMILQHGLSFAGLVLVPINPAYRSREIEVILRNSHAAGIIYIEKSRDNDIESIVKDLMVKLPDLRHAIPLTAVGSLIANAPTDGPLPAVGPDDIIQIQFTSGTTGVPKGACLHHRGVVNSSRFVAQRAGFPEAGVWLNALPMFHIAAPVVAEMAALSRCGTFVLAPHFDAELMLELIESERVNASLIVPTMIIAMLEHPEFARRDVSSMQIVVTGASMVPESLVLRTKAAFDCNMVIQFGQTETNGTACQTSPEDSLSDQTRTVGRPLPQVEVKIVDPSSGEIQPVGEAGEVCFRGYQTMRGYCGSPEATAAVLKEDGWLHSGDLGEMDSRGYIRLVGRLKEMIIRGGINIYPKEIENVLFEHPHVSEVSVVGVPDERWGEVLAAVIRLTDPSSPPTPAELRQFCRDRLAPYKAPSLWFFVQSYPLTPSGKVQKFELQRWIARGEILPAEQSGL